MFLDSPRPACPRHCRRLGHRPGDRRPPDRTRRKSPYLRCVGRVPGGFHEDASERVRHQGRRVVGCRCGETLAAVKASLGGLDALVNNAGVAGPTGGVEEIRPEDWRRTIDICLTGQFLCAHHGVPMLKAAGGGAIVNLSSSAGRFGYAFRTPYSAAKWGVIGLTQSLAKELGPHNIRVNAVLPGIVEGPRMTRVIEARAKQMDVSYEAMEKTYLDRVSLRRMVTAGDVAASVAYLLSPAGRNLSGLSLAVDGNVETL